jgi:hypothetical protein
MAHRSERLSAAERRPKAWELAKAGASLRQIAAAVGISHKQARRDVVGELARLNAESQELAEHYRTLHLARCEAMHVAVYPKAVRGDYAAIASVLRILERESKLLGLDSATKVDLDVSVHDMSAKVALELGMTTEDVLEEAARIVARHR